MTEITEQLDLFAGLEDEALRDFVKDVIVAIETDNLDYIEQLLHELIARYPNLR